MTREEAEEYAKEMAYRDAVCNALQGRCIPYRKATLIKLYELLDRLEQEPCEDAISREDALMCLTGEWTEITDEIIHRFIKRIKALPPVNPQPKWIPVSERLPETDGDYLLFGKAVKDDTEDTFIGMYDACAEVFGYWEDYYDKNTLGFLDSELIEYNKVIAWMPLPIPYKPQESEDNG